MVSLRRLSSAFGFVCMLGGALFGLLLVLSSLLVTESASAAGIEAFGSVLLLSVVFLLPGGVALYLVQRPVFGWVGKLASALFLVGLTAFTILLFLPFLGVEPGNPIPTVVLATAVGGQFAFGVATAYNDVLAHGRIGGVLLALAFPLAIGTVVLLSTLGVEQSWLGSVVLAGLFGGTWILLGLDLLTAAEGGVETVSSTAAD